MKNNQKNSLGLWLLVLVIVLIGAYFVMKSSLVPSSSTTQAPKVQNSEDLQTVSGDLDNTNINQLDSEMNQLNSDSVAF